MGGNHVNWILNHSESLTWRATNCVVVVHGLMIVVFFVVFLFVCKLLTSI